MYYRPVYFDASELFPESIVTRVGDAAFGLIDERILVALDGLRMAYGAPLYINGKGRDESGMRVLGTSTGASKSRHKPLDSGVQAFDLHLDRGPHANDELHKWIVANGQAHNVLRVESLSSTPSWVHIEIGVAKSSSVRIFDP
jgi:hypothetical protein